MRRSRACLVLGIVGGALRAQAPIDATQLAPNFYTLRSARVGVLVGPDGVFLVDSGPFGYTDRIISAVQEISNAPIRFLAYTSPLAGHIGGNEAFAGLGVTVLARPQARERLQYRASSPIALPVITYDAPITRHMNGEEIEVIPVPHAYTDGDTIVHFVNADVIMTGELFQSVSYPEIDRANGGTLKGLIDGLNRIVAMAGPKTKIVPGHDGYADRTAVAAQRDMILLLRDRVAAMVRQGKSELEVLNANLNADYPSTRLGPNAFMRELYQELRAGN